ncbi:MAG: hypothetical protein HY912_19510 [Desulfomonile tiedjei]|uniref:Uncharacterized protein n=1 Tax=Desulfomonile tiedjei TaxID=2358 RepID=A0A9D6Z831_9BACT|nr:hypothetical protein [Desulfomonile tiedjei]
MVNNKEEYVDFDAQEFFDQLLKKLERALEMDLKPAIKEEPFWMFSVPEEVTDGEIKSFFMLMAKEEDNHLEIHYGNSKDGDFYMVTFTGATRHDFVRCVHDMLEHVYGMGPEAFQ